MKAVYLDASALVKLVKPEPETDALWQALAGWSVGVSSELLTVEMRCTARRLGGQRTLERTEATLATVDLVPFTPAIRDRAGGTAFTPALRALDAIHLATALTVQQDLALFFAYDADLTAAAAAHGLDVAAPR